MTSIVLAHKICLEPTYKQINYFMKACGTARFAYNWALSQWIAQFKDGQKPSGYSLKKEFNALKETQFPWVYEVSKYACQQPFIFLQNAFNNFFKGHARYPTFKKKGVHDILEAIDISRFGLVLFRSGSFKKFSNRAGYY